MDPPRLDMIGVVVVETRVVGYKRRRKTWQHRLQRFGETRGGGGGWGLEKPACMMVEDWIWAGGDGDEDSVCGVQGLDERLVS